MHPADLPIKVDAVEHLRDLAPGHVVAYNLAAGMNVAFEKTTTVLVVGKQPKEIAYLTRHLSIAGYDSLVARTGAGAIKAIKEHAPAAVILEIDLSDMEGVDVVRAIRENPGRAETPIIAISAFPYMRSMCLEYGCNAFIQKPIKALELLAQLRKLTKV